MLVEENEQAPVPVVEYNFILVSLLMVAMVYQWVFETDNIPVPIPFEPVTNVRLFMIQEIIAVKAAGRFKHVPACHQKRAANNVNA